MKIRFEAIVELSAEQCVELNIPDAETMGSYVEHMLEHGGYDVVDVIRTEEVLRMDVRKVKCSQIQSNQMQCLREGIVVPEKAVKGDVSHACCAICLALYHKNEKFKKIED